MNKTDKKHTISIVGIGKWGKNLLRDFNKISQIKSVFDGENSKNEKWLKENYPNIKLVKSYDEILEDGDVSSVVIATPINTHYTIAKKALFSQKNVFLEKPASTVSSEVTELIEIAKKNKLVFFTGFVLLYDEIFNRVEEISKKENILEISSIWIKSNDTGSEIIPNLASHDFSIFFSIFGKPENIKVLEKNDKKVKIILDFPNNKNASIQIDIVDDKKDREIKINTDKNSYVWLGNTLGKIKENGEVEHIYTHKKTPLENEISYFIQKVNSTNKETNENISLLVTEYIEKTS